MGLIFAPAPPNQFRGLFFFKNATQQVHYQLKEKSLKASTTPKTATRPTLGGRLELLLVFIMDALLVRLF